MFSSFRKGKKRMFQIRYPTGQRDLTGCLSCTASGIPHAGGSILFGSFGGISARPGAPNCPGSNVNAGMSDSAAAFPLAGKGCCVSTCPYDEVNYMRVQNNIWQRSCES